MTVDFYLDCISPFVYLARGRLLEIAARHEATVTYHPVDIHQLRANAGSTGPSNSAIPAKMAYFQRDYRRWAELYGMPITETLSGYATGVFNRGLYLAIDRGQADRYIEEACACIWRDGRDPGSADEQARLSECMGWQPGKLAEFAATAEADKRYADEIAAASARGVFGVPTFFIGDEMWWGNDRLDFLERYLEAQSG